MAFPDEKRWALIAKIEGKAWTAIYTVRGETIRLISVRPARPKAVRSYAEKRLAKSAAEFDRRFEAGEDIHDIADLSKARISRPGRKVRITLDIPETLVRDIDDVRERIGVDRGALIKVWLHERVAQEKVG